MGSGHGLKCGEANLKYPESYQQDKCPCGFISTNVCVCVLQVKMSQAGTVMQAQKMVEQLREQAALDRIKVSDSSRE